jgi:Glucodextranase, domain B/PASTA domain
MRLGPFIAAGSAAAILGGCGADDPPLKPQKPVVLQVSAPSDTAVVHGATMQVRGTVNPPGARVKVQGHIAQVNGGTFSSNVTLDQGANVIDVAASASGRSVAMTAFRVTREERVSVPQLVGLSLDDAKSEAAKGDLKLQTERGGGFLDPLVPRRLGVCEQSPTAGKQVRRGTTVQLLVARSC